MTATDFRFVGVFPLSQEGSALRTRLIRRGSDLPSTLTFYLFLPTLPLRSFSGAEYYSLLQLQMVRCVNLGFPFLSYFFFISAPFPSFFSRLPFLAVPYPISHSLLLNKLI